MKVSGHGPFFWNLSAFQGRALHDLKQKRKKGGEGGLTEEERFGKIDRLSEDSEAGRKKGQKKRLTKRERSAKLNKLSQRGRREAAERRKRKGKKFLTKRSR